MGELIGMVVAGAVVGGLARLFVKKDTAGMSVLWTIILGALGALIGGWGAGLLGVASTPGVDWIRWILSIICAMVLIGAFLGSSRGK